LGNHFDGDRFQSLGIRDTVRVTVAGVEVEGRSRRTQRQPAPCQVRCRHFRAYQPAASGRGGVVPSMRTLVRHCL